MNSKMVQSKLSIPDCVRGMVELDKNKFITKILIPVIAVKVDLINSVMVTLKKYLLKVENFPSVQDHDQESRLLHLNPDLVINFDSFDEKDRKLLKKYNITEENLSTKEITLTYDNWRAHDIIKAVIPPSQNFSRYTNVGKIIHVNLKPELLPYRFVIGQVLLDKMKHCESVVHKVNTIDNAFRTFDIEVLAGSDDLCTEVKENNCRFQLNFRTVYWNSRLSEEHYEIITKLNRGDVLYDVFCGIGPFAIPAAKKGCHVLANDANPESIKYLSRNEVLNKITSNLYIYNKDGAAFIKEDLKPDMLKRSRTFDYKKPNRIHITMNLPALAYTFLKSFVGLFEENELSSYPNQLLPIVHLYCFIKDKHEIKEKAKRLVEETLNTEIDDMNIFLVRNVSPSKEMVRVSFTLSKEILQSQKRKMISSTENISEIKKSRLEKDENITLEMDTSDYQ